MGMMANFNISEEVETITKDLEREINSLSPNHNFKSLYHYAVLPPGKAFRPLLVKAIARDLDPEILKNVRKQKNLKKMASAIEIHHSYTLVHDDMP